MAYQWIFRLRGFASTEEPPRKRERSVEYWLSIGWVFCTLLSPSKPCDHYISFVFTLLTYGEWSYSMVGSFGLEGLAGDRWVTVNPDVTTCVNGVPAEILGDAAVLLLVLDINEFNTIANPLICADWRRDTLISSMSIVPFAVDPRRTAGGGAWPSATETAGTGWIPSACKAGSDATGSWTGIAVLLEGVGRGFTWKVVVVGGGIVAP